MPAAVVELVTGRQVVRHPQHRARRDGLNEPLLRAGGGMAVPDEQDVIVRGQFLIQFLGPAEGLTAHAHDRVEPRSIAIEGLNAPKVRLDQGAASELTRQHR